MEVLKRELSMVGHTCNTSTRESEAGGSVVQGQLRLHSVCGKQTRSKQKNTAPGECENKAKKTSLAPLPPLTSPPPLL